MENNKNMTPKEGAEKITKMWQEDAALVKEEYPEFDLKKALENKTFAGLLRGGARVKIAYEVAFIEEIKDYIQRKTEEQVMETVRKNGARPKENGTNAAKGGAVTSSVKNMTAQQRAEIAKRAAKGEAISLQDL